jgi:hypothetical protein
MNWIYLFALFHIEQSRCEFHLTTKDERLACFYFSHLTEHLDKVETLRIGETYIKQDYRFRVGINKVKNEFHGIVSERFHVFKLRISCENRKHFIHL